MTAVLIDVLKMWLCENVKNALNVLYMYYILDKFMPRVSDIFWSRSYFIQFPTFWTESRIYSRPKYQQQQQYIYFFPSLQCHLVVN